MTAEPGDPGDDARVTISVILPTHDELANLRVLLPRLDAVLADESCEFIVVDDASTDGSVEWLTSRAAEDARIRPIFGDALRGIGHALRRGYDAARGEIIVSVDADLSFEPEVAPALVRAIRAGADLVIGSRHHPEGRYEAPDATIARKRFVSRTANRLLTALIPVGVHDFSVNCRAVRRTLWMRLSLEERTNIWLIEMIVAAACLRARLAEVPVRFKDREFGESKLRLGREILLTGYRVLAMVGRYWRSRLAGPVPPP